MRCLVLKTLQQLLKSTEEIVQDPKQHEALFPQTINPPKLKKEGGYCQTLERAKYAPTKTK